jgi:glycosyltransferase involved in cell wall biosynthesis
VNRQKKVIVSVINDLTTDQRVHKVCKYLEGKGFRVLLVGRVLPTSEPLNRSYATKRMRLVFSKGAFFYAEFQLRLLLFLLFRKADLLVANDLDTILPNYLVSKARRIPVVYDTHEYFLGVPEIQSKAFVKKVWGAVERFCFPKIKDIITVNDSIAALYQSDYGIAPKVVRNIPLKKTLPTPLTRKDLNLPEDEPIILLQGAGINVDRGAEEAVAAMQYLDKGLLLIVGDGDVLPQLKVLVKELRLDKKVRFIARVPFEVLASYTQLAAIGLSIDKLDNVNYINSLPNKLFDYMHAGVPILASRVKEVAKIIEAYDIGILIDSHDPKHMAACMETMISNADKTKRWKANLVQASNDMTWQKECKILDTIYNKYA